MINNTLLIWFTEEYFDIQYVKNTIKLDYYNYYFGSHLNENDMCGIPEQLEETFIEHLKEIIQ